MRLYELIWYPVYASACLRVSAEIPYEETFKVSYTPL